MEIESIDQIENTSKYEILFVNDEVEPILKIILDKDQLWKISNYCKEHLSYGAQLRNKKDINSLCFI
jgi:predicted methyltransferase